MQKFRLSKIELSLILVFLFACATPETADKTATPAQIQHSYIPYIKDGLVLSTRTPEVQDSGVLFVHAQITRPLTVGEPTLKGLFEKTEFALFRESPTQWGGLVGIPYDHAPGPSQVEVSVTDPSNNQVVGKAVLSFTILKGKYPSETLKVDPDKVTPPAEAMKEIELESAEIHALYEKSDFEKRWDGNFKLPVNSPVTSRYGSRRVYNGELKSAHQGLDLRAKTGTPIRSPSPGKVVLAKNLYYTGNTVILDHGFGIFTIYAHMSRLKVKPGDLVKTGQNLGLAGMTGRANGPHLHWGGVIQGVKVNPLYLTRLYP